MRDRLTDAAPYISIFGLFLLIASLVVWQMTGVPPQVMPTLAVAGGVLALAWPLLRPAEVRAALSGRQARYGGNALVLALSVLGILVVVNYLGTRRYAVWDLTANQQFTLSRQTKQILAELAEPVRLTAVLPINEPQQTADDLEALVDRYRQNTDRITFEVLRPQIDPLAYQQLKARIDMADAAPGRGLVAESGGRHALVYSFDEQAVTEAVVKATRTRELTVAFTTGHGEHSLDGDAEGGGYSIVRQNLEREGYTVKGVSLATMTETLPTDGAVVVAGPRRPFRPEEAERLADYVTGGGALMVLVDPQVDPGLGPVLAPWAVILHDDLVLDPERAVFGRPNFIGVEGGGYRFHTITKDLESFASLFPNARSIGIGTAITPSLLVESLVVTSDGAWGETGLAALAETGAQPVKDADEEAGLLNLAVAASGGEDDGRLVVFGTSALATDGLFGQVPGVANLDLVLNAVNWLTQEEDLISISPKSPDEHPITPPQNPLLLILSTALFAPLVVLGVGTWLWWRRR